MKYSAIMAVAILLICTSVVMTGNAKAQTYPILLKELAKIDKNENEFKKPKTEDNSKTQHQPEKTVHPEEIINLVEDKNISEKEVLDELLYLVQELRSALVLSKKENTVKTLKTDEKEDDMAELLAELQVLSNQLRMKVDNLKEKIISLNNRDK